MPAIDDIYKLRSELEDGGPALNNTGGILNYLSARNITAVTRSNAPAQLQKATPRVEIKALVGAANGHRFICPDGFTRFDRWRLTLALQCVTVPAGDGQNAIGEVLVSTVKDIMSTLAQNTWTDVVNFPNIRIAEPLREMGDRPVLKSEEGYEYTVISYQGTLCVRETAWQ